MNRSALFLFAAAAFLGGCSSPSSMFSRAAPPPACPTASLLDGADRITVYRPGPGRDIADIAYEARLTGLEGDCAYEIAKKSKKPEEQTYKSVAMNLKVHIRVTPGPAMSGFTVPVKYFVAIPEFYPQPEGRAEFARTVETSVARTQVEVTDTNIEIRVPLNEKRRGDSVVIYAGFILSEDQLRENQTRDSGRIDR